jgi:hypothetical protein
LLETNEARATSRVRGVISCEWSALKSQFSLRRAPSLRAKVPRKLPSSR